MTLSDYKVIGVESDISLDTFDRILREAQSPALSSAHAVWNYCARRKVSPAFLLAIFKAESGFGLHGTATLTHSYGNTRLPNFGGVPDMGTVPGRSGVFPVFANWADGGIATAARFLDHAPYAGKTTVRGIIPVWAPPTDQNDTEAYIAAVLASITEWTKGAPPVAYSKRQQIVPVGSPNRPGNLLNGNGVATAYTIHNTANPSAGANAAMHANYVGNGGGPDSSSYHDVADDHEVVNLIPYNEAAFHIGDWSTGPGWIRSYGIEICENAGIDFPQACRNAARAVAERMVADGHAGEYGRVKKHGEWWTPQHPQVHKGCPARLLAGWQGVTWEVFLGMVKAATEQLQGGATKAPVSPVVDPGFVGALTPTGGLIINGQSPPDPGILESVVALEATGRNPKGEFYSIKWENHGWGAWRKVG